jgi:hypothetical protein
MSKTCGPSLGGCLHFDPCQIRLRSGGLKRDRAAARSAGDRKRFHPYDLRSPHHRRPHHPTFMPPSLQSAPAKPLGAVAASLAGEASSSKRTRRYMRHLGTGLILRASQLRTPSLTTTQEHWIILVMSFGDVLTRTLVWLVLRWFDQFRWDFDPQSVVLRSVPPRKKCLDRQFRQLSSTEP